MYACVTSSSSGRGRIRGFTLIELIMVVLIVSALAVFAMPKVLDVTIFRLASFADRIQNATTFANRLALAQRRPIVVTFVTTGVSIAYGSGGAINLPVIDPSTGSTMSLTCPSATPSCISTTGSVTFNANNTGATLTPSSAPFQVTVTGTGFTQNFTVEPVSGLVRKT